MASDDMAVLMYKALRYLHWCMRKGEEPQESRLMHDGDLFGVPLPYWADVWDELASRGLVKGASVKYADNMPEVRLDRPRPTLEGEQFMRENAAMRRAAEYLKEAKSALPFI